MKNYNKYLLGLLISMGLVSCDVNNDLDPIPEEQPAVVELNVNGLDLSKYVSVGASFTAGVTDGALFIASQENSFPNILASKFKMANGGDFAQPLMNDNIGGFVTTTGVVAQPPRLYFNGTGPTELSATPTTIFGAPAANAGNLNNFGVPGAKSFHLVTPNYGNPAGLAALPLTANPYFVRMGSPSGTTIMTDVAAASPTFFTLSEIGGNDVLGYALSGGYNPEVKHPVTGAVIVPASNAIYQSDNTVSPANYGANDITNTDVFSQTFNGIVGTLTAGNAKGVIVTLPYITSLAHFTTVPHNPLDPRENSDLAGQVPLLNTVYGAINQIFVGAGQTNRVITFDPNNTNPVVIKDENLPNLSSIITTQLVASPTFAPFVQSLGLPAQAAPLVAQLLGRQYGQARPATANDLLVLPSSTVIGTINTKSVQTLMSQGIPQNLAGQFSAEGITLPLEDKWVLTPEEQKEIKDATDAYNQTITAVANANANVTLVDLKDVLNQASMSGVTFDNYTLTTQLVFGGLISLDGVHLTSRGYALMANKILEAMDRPEAEGGFGTNFTKATNGLAKAGDYPTNYSGALR